MAPDDGATNPGGRPKSPVDQWFELFVYAPLGLALDARQLLPRLIDRGRSQVVLARVVGRYAVERGSTRAGDYMGQSGSQLTAVLQALGLVGDEAGPDVDQADLDDFEGEVISFESAARGAAPADEPGDADDEPEPDDTPDVATLAIPDYDNLSASQVVPRLGGLSATELEAVARYETARRGRKTILNKVAQLEIGVIESARRADIDDLARLDELARQAIEQMRPLRGGMLWSLTLARQEPLIESLAASLVDPDQRIVVGCIDDVIIGYGAMRVQGLSDGQPLGVIEELYVEPEARAVGVGEAMMDLLLEWCNERGCIGVDAVALPGDRETKNFFETYGLTARAIVVHRRLGPADDA